MQFDRFEFYDPQADLLVEMKPTSIRLTVTDKRFPHRRTAQIEIQADRLAGLANFFAKFAAGAPSREIAKSISAMRPSMYSFPMPEDDEATLPSTSE